MKGANATTNMMLALSILVFSPVYAGAQTQDTGAASDNQSQLQQSGQQYGQGSRHNFREQRKERWEARRENWQQVESTLTPDQHKKISAIKEQSRQTTEPLRQKMQALRQQLNGNSAGQNTDNLRSQMKDLHQQMRAAFSDEHEKTRAVLTDKQREMLAKPDASQTNSGDGNRPNP